jgi:hypothetical protein
LNNRGNSAAIAKDNEKIYRVGMKYGQGVTPFAHVTKVPSWARKNMQQTEEAEDKANATERQEEEEEEEEERAQ